MIENTFFLTISIYLALGVFVIFCFVEFINEIRIKRRRQKEWDAIKFLFRCKDEISLKRLYQSYIATIDKHWFLGYIYPDI